MNTQYYSELNAILFTKIKQVIFTTILVATVLSCFACSKKDTKSKQDAPAEVKLKTRIACVGNSITAGFGLEDAEHQAWPAQLATNLGDKYSVLNCGVSGTTMLKSAANSYWNTSAFNNAKGFDPQIVIIMLGTNDAHPDNWTDKEHYYIDYVAMIEAFRANGKMPKIYICYPVACYGDTRQIDNLQNEIIPAIKQIGQDENATVIDLNTPTQKMRAELYNDNLHPNVNGASLLAKLIAQQINATYDK